jgi:hypothetical protein
MKIKSLVLATFMGLGTLTLAGCVEGGGYSGGYVTSYGGPFYGDGFYGGYGDGYYHGYRRDGRYYRPHYADNRRDWDRRRNNDRPRGPGRDFRRDGGGNGRVFLPSESPRGAAFGRGGAP